LVDSSWRGTPEGKGLKAKRRISVSKREGLMEGVGREESKNHLEHKIGEGRVSGKKKPANRNRSRFLCGKKVWL